MRALILVGCLFAPIGVAAYHYGPGQRQLELDKVHELTRAAQKRIDAEDYSGAVALFDQALSSLPGDCETAGRRIRLERAKAHLRSGQLPAAYDELAILVPELQADPSTDAPLLADARKLQANTKYYLTWLERLEGKPRADWEPEIEGARQLYRLLAEQSRDAGDSQAARRHQEDLEATIRLARMDLSELQALPLPSQCQGCCSGDCKCKGKGKGKGQGKTTAKPESDSFARGASSGPPPDNSGN